MEHNVYIYILVMALVTYLIRALPLLLIHRDIKNQFFRSFLYYVPYVTLSAMVFPAILYCTGNMVSAAMGFIVAIILAYRECSLTNVALFACATVYIVNLI